MLESKTLGLQMEYTDIPSNAAEERHEDIRHSKKGLSFIMASFFIVGGTAGTGVLILPRAMVDAGWAGIVLVFFCCCNAVYAGICLGRCWSILEERYEEYRRKHRYPYPAIAYRAAGLKMRYFASVCLEINLLGLSIALLLLASELITMLARQCGLAFCYWIIIIALILYPFMWLGTPKDFWQAAVIAVLSTVTACVLIIIAIIMDAQVTTITPSFPPPDVYSFFSAFGMVYFSFGGAASFPTFQNDMEDKTNFPTAVITGFSILLLFYFPVAVLGYSIYGNNLASDIVRSLPSSGLTSAITFFLAVRTLSAFLIIINASSQEFEELFKIPNTFGWKRIALRSGILVFLLFVALSVPRFEQVINLMAGSAIILTASVFPCLFYYQLCSQRNPEWPVRFISIYEKVYLIVIIVCGIIGGIFATYSAFRDIIIMNNFNPPCYVNITAASEL